VSALLALGPPEEIDRRWRNALKLTHPTHYALWDFGRWWNRVGETTGPPKGALQTTNADWTNRSKSFEEELADGL